MRAIDLIETKRDGGALSGEQIRWLITEYTAGNIPDYQLSALLMAIYFRGMNRQETVDLTLAMAASGDQIDLHDVVPFTVDKHSSGGVGDKTTLVVQPLVAAMGIPVGKMSGRGLGASGGTLDKMESITGWQHKMDIEQYKKQLVEVGMVLAGQTAVLAPADGKLYALRDVTGTVASIPLIAASIMSKKLATGADAIVLDVKVGSGAFMRTVDDARELAQIMVNIGRDAGRKMAAILSDMNQPLGQAIGNALEVKEAIETLQGGGPADFWAHCLEVAGNMVVLAEGAADLDEAKEKLTAIRDGGEAWQKFRQLVEYQGGDLSQIDDPSQLPQAPLTGAVTAPSGGYIAGMDTGAIGWAAVQLGAGRKVKTDPIDHSVGMIMPAKVGDYVEEGGVIATIYAADEEALATAQKAILGAIKWSQRETTALPHFYGTIH
ncbi:MAG TPA: thymidine phosphorylase [Anaerolineae bacterium]|nr:thymidine phosphorylase [Anaerolineae bacterium]